MKQTMGRDIKRKAQISKKLERASTKDRKNAGTAPDIEALINRYEFHRHGMAILPSPGDKRPGVAYFIRKDDRDPGMRFCTCAISKNRTCSHILQLMQVYKTLRAGLKGKSPDEDFRSGIWFRIASILGEGDFAPLKDIRISLLSRKSGSITRITDADNQELMRYFSPDGDLSRFIERCMVIPGDEEDHVPNRNSVLSTLSLHTLKQSEWMMIERGFKTRGQALEESFWFRAAYHGYREFGNRGCRFHPAIDKRSGSFTVTCRDLSGSPVFRMAIPRNMVKRLLLSLAEYLPNQNSIAIHPIPLKSIFHVDMSTELDLEVRPLIEMIQEDGEAKFFKREDLERFRYSDLVYIPELGIMAELEQPGRERKFRAPVKMVLKKSQVPEFLDEFGEELFDEINIVAPEVKAIRIARHYDRVEINPGALDRDWCWLSVMYGFGNDWVSLGDILSARKEGQRYIATSGGWVDSRSLELLELSDIFQDIDLETGADRLKFSRMDLFRLATTSRNGLRISGGDKGSAELLKRIMDLRPSHHFPELKGLKSSLRSYQKLGVEWISFLFENRFGGLLCDDMGLGKTHQVMAFLLALREQFHVKAPFLVVCPTTVLSHWKSKIQEHAPSLQETIYHGGDRDLEDALGNGNLLLTSYGILLRDINALKKISFPIAVFDEIQHIKNPETKAYGAALDIDAVMKLGLTGTPIENRLEELKALFDLTLPGYLGTDEYFTERYAHPIQDLRDTERQKKLSRLVSPFILRRLKKSVLKELPEKIEDVMSCSLSEDQVKLYRDAISTRGAGLIHALKSQEEPVPYIHIFALLNILKQICNHPALIEKAPAEYEKYQSGKWDLFQEILIESIGSGQKVVVYSQYLGMIEIMERFLKKADIAFVSLTGSSRKRGKIIKRFNDDPECRVFIGSLRAGGVGIDLVAASVVIHYDRWWNAAREDQATDRVHRIGQKRGVQVFKLVTEGTLEEKISAIIARKKNLMDSVIKEDDPGLLKLFSREELIELIEFQENPLLSS